MRSARETRTWRIAVVGVMAATMLGMVLLSPLGPRATALEPPPRMAQMGRVGGVSLAPAGPTPREAEAAVRRHRVGTLPLDHADVTLGRCAADGALARCPIGLVWDARRGGPRRQRLVTFGQVAGRWEVMIW